MGLFDFFKKSKTKKLKPSKNIPRWFSNLSTEEQVKARDYYSELGCGKLEADLINDNQQKLMSIIGDIARSHKDYAFAEKILLKALQVEDDNPTDRHFVYNHLIKLYYRQRDIKNNSIEKCIHYCTEDIRTIVGFLVQWHDKYPELAESNHPRIPSFKRLAIIYEKQGKIKDGIEICEKALKLGLEDGTKGGFKGRKKRLQKKKN